MFGVLGTALAAIDLSLLRSRAKALVFPSGVLTLLYWLILWLAWQYDLSEQ
ncbi:hypothetical protein ACQP2T_46995 [Nonomuraea sp. CA-143628]|uniref:hypothetical protein n=1 Tax=Nonomuraea sp. CA-143628 TaxID=3239997 RepID=UPI003D8CDDF3